MGYNDYVYLYFASKQENKGIKKMKEFRKLPDDKYGHDILTAMVILNKLESIDKRILKRILVIGLHNLNEDEKALLYQTLKK